jgi:hypothetical protein
VDWLAILGKVGPALTGAARLVRAVGGVWRGSPAERATIPASPPPPPADAYLAGANAADHRHFMAERASHAAARMSRDLTDVEPFEPEQPLELEPDPEQPTLEQPEQPLEREKSR